MNRRPTSYGAMTPCSRRAIVWKFPSGPVRNSHESYTGSTTVCAPATGHAACRLPPVRPRPAFAPTSVVGTTAAR